MKKKLLSGVLAIAMLFGSAAALPKESFTDITYITASAAEPTINTESVTLYALDDWAKEFISIPSAFDTEYQLNVSNAKNVSYYVSSGDSVDVSSSGVVTPRTTTFYWYGSFGTSWRQEGQEPTKITVEVNYGKSTITVNADGKTFSVNAEVKDYSDTYANKVMDDYIKKNIKSSMTGLQKITEIAKFVASYDYSASYYDCTSMIVAKGGDCWASTDTIIKMCKKLGIEAWSRNGNRDSGAGSGHKNAMVYVDGKYYEVEAGYGGTAPRPYDITQRDSLFSFRYNYTYDGYEVYQYDGKTNPQTLTVPEEYNGKPVVSVGDKFLESEKGIKKVVLPSTIKSIGRSAFNSCEDLESINLPASLTEIDEFAFTNLTKLKVITGSNEIFKWKNGGLIKDGTVLIFVPNAQSYTIPSTVTEIAPYSFYYNKNIKKLTIPSSVKTIGEGAIGDCDSLENIYILGNSLKTLESFAFSNNKKLGSVYIPDSVTNIGENFKYYLGSEFKILCHEGSKIAEYAEKENIPFEIIDKSMEHLYKSAVTKAATCTEDGVRTYTCQMCGKSFIEAIAKLGHKYTTKQVKVTCTTDGCTLKTCSRCNKQVKSNIVKAAGHKWSEWTTTKKATCIEDGTQTSTCSVCGETKTQTIAKHGHSWKAPVWSWSGTTDATAEFVCSNCQNTRIVHASITFSKNTAKCGTTGGTVYTAKVSLSGKTYTDQKTVGTGTASHNWGAVTYIWSKDNSSCTAKRVCKNDASHIETETVKTTYKIVKANCTADGIGRYTAVFTNKAFGAKTKDINLKAFGHSYTTKIVAPTCTAKGYTLHKCTRCGDSYKDTYTAAKGHSWSAWKTTKKANCTTAGTKVRTCSVCGKKETQTIKATGHKFSAWKTTGFDLKNNTSTQTRKCSVCGKTEKQTTKNAVSRFAGANRYDTAALISQGMYSKGTDTVIVATGLDFHDALVAVPLANAYKAPLLLTTDKQVTKHTEAELARLKAKKVIIVSTNDAVGAVVKTALAKYNPTMISGDTCYETATKVAEAMQKKAGKAPDTIFFATDSAFADALSASPVAAIKNAPIIYLKNTGSIDSATAAYLKSVKGKVKNAYIIGGDGVISNTMMKNVAAALGLKVGSTVQRVAGKNRYETCVAVNNKFKSVLSSDGICVAKGLDFPDALAGGVYAAKNRQALFLADGKKLQDVQNSYLKSKNASKITVFGGTGAVPDDLVKLIAKASV